MKLINLFCAGALSALALTACTDNDDNSTWNNGSQAITFNASIQGADTRAAGSKWAAGDAIGIYMTAADGELSAATAINKKYITDASGALTAATGEDALYYPSNGSSVDFVAYYPYAASIANLTYKVNVVDQADQPAIDLLYANNAKGYNKETGTNPALSFTHQLSQIVFNIEKDATVPTLNGLTITFTGMNTTADFALADGALSNAATVANIDMKVDGTTATAIVLPAAALNDVKIRFTLGGKAFEAAYPQAELLAGKKYVHKVTLSDQNGQPTIKLDAATITDWTEVAGGDINVDFGEGGGEETPSEVTLLDEPFDANQGAFTIKDVQLPEGSTYVWKWSSYTDGTQYMKASSYISGAQKAAESWLISPALDMTAATAATLTFDHCHKFGADKTSEMTLWVAEDGTENWTQLTIPTYGSGNDYTYVTATVDLTAHVGKKVKVAFKYLSTAAAGATWQINSVKVVATTTDGGTVDPEPEPEPTPGENLVVNPGFEDWTADLATGWDNSYNIPVEGISKSTDVKRSGNNALKQISVSSTSKIQQEVAVTGGKTYKISYWFLDNDAAARARTWCTWVAGDQTLADNADVLHPSTYSSDNAEWQQATFTLVAPATADTFRFEVRTYKGDDGSVGGFIYYDDFEIVEVAQ